MKKWILITAAALMLCGCGSQATASSSPESTNNAGAINLDAEPADMSAYVFLSDDDPAFLEISTAQSLKLVTEKGTGMLIYSYETCPWCNRVIPVLNKAAKKAGREVFYVNIYSDDFMSKSEQDKADIIQSLYEVMDPALEHEKNEETGEEEPVMKVPLVIAIKDGEIVAHHVGVIDGFELDTDNLDDYQLTDEQVSDLEDIYLEMFKKIE